MKNILVTGGCGFVGRHLIKKLLESGYDVDCVDPIVPLTGGIDPVDWPLFYPIDYKFHYYKTDCRKFFQQTDKYYDYTFHLAAIVGGREMIENNPLAVADDLSIDAAYWQWARKAKPGKTVCFSSSAAYPISLQRKDTFRLLKENDISFDDKLGVPDMTYGWAKLTHEFLAKMAYEKHGLKSVVYRPFSGYGEDQNDSYPFPSICKRAINLVDKQMPVWGSGLQMRDFIHIEDCVDGILQTMDTIDDASAINLSTGIYHSFIELAEIALSVLGKSASVTGMSDKPEGVFARGGDTTKQKALGFNYKIDLRNGVKQALKYYDNNLDPVS